MELRSLFHHSNVFPKKGDPILPEDCQNSVACHCCEACNRLAWLDLAPKCDIRDLSAYRQRATTH